MTSKASGQWLQKEEKRLTGHQGQQEIPCVGGPRKRSQLLCSFWSSCSHLPPCLGSDLLSLLEQRALEQIPKCTGHSVSKAGDTAEQSILLYGMELPLPCTHSLDHSLHYNSYNSSLRSEGHLETELHLLSQDSSLNLGQTVPVANSSNRG